MLHIENDATHQHEPKKKMFNGFMYVMYVMEKDMDEKYKTKDWQNWCEITAGSSRLHASMQLLE